MTSTKSYTDGFPHTFFHTFCGNSPHFSPRYGILSLCMEYFSQHIPYTFPHDMEYEKALITSYYHNNDRLERYMNNILKL